MKAKVLLYPILPALVCGTLNWLYWRKKGHSSPTQLVMSILIFYVAFYGVMRVYTLW